MHVDFGENRSLFLIIHAINWVVKIKSPFYQGIESASSPGLYSLDVQYFRRTVFPRELGPGGGPYSLREYGPPDRKLGPDRIPYDTGMNMYHAYMHTTHTCNHRFLDRRLPNAWEYCKHCIPETALAGRCVYTTEW